MTINIASLKSINFYGEAKTDQDGPNSNNKNRKSSGSTHELGLASRTNILPKLTVSKVPTNTEERFKEHISKISEISSYISEHSIFLIKNYLYPKIAVELDKRLNFLSLKSFTEPSKNVSANKCKPLDKLPNDILCHISSFLNTIDKVNLTMVSKRFSHKAPEPLYILKKDNLILDAKQQAKSWISNNLNNDQLNFDQLNNEKLNDKVITLFGIFTDWYEIPENLVEAYVKHIAVENAFDILEKLDEGSYLRLYLEKICFESKLTTDQVDRVLSIASEKMSHDSEIKDLLVGIKDNISQNKLDELASRALKKMSTVGIDEIWVDWEIVRLIVGIKGSISSEDKLVDLASIAIEKMSDDFWIRQLLVGIKDKFSQDKLSQDKLESLTSVAIVKMSDDLWIHDLLVGI